MQVMRGYLTPEMPRESWLPHCVRMRTSHIKSLKHGGISMLATIGYIALEIMGKLPGYLSTYMGSEYRNSVFKVLTACGSGQLRAKMSADRVNSRLDMMVIICMIIPGWPL